MTPGDLTINLFPSSRMKYNAISAEDRLTGCSVNTGGQLNTFWRLLGC
jgi:hypothetical protein